MPYRTGTELEYVRLIVHMNAGGMGDMIARMPALKYSLEQHPHIMFDIYVFDFMVELFEVSFKSFHERVKIKPRSQFGPDSKDFVDVPVIDFHPIQVSASKNSLTDYGFQIIENRSVAKGPAWDYLQPDLTNVDISGYNLPKRYGVLCTGYTAPVREWLPKHAFDVADWMIQNGITPVYLGKRVQAFEGPQRLIEAHLKNEAIHPQGIDLRDATSLLEALKVMSQAQFVAGIDNGLLHLASMSDVPTIWGFTSILPSTRLPFRHGQQGWRALFITPEDDLACRFCQTRQNYIKSKNQFEKYLGHDYKFCYYDDYKCLEQMTAGKFISKIKEVIGYKGHGARMGNEIKYNRSKRPR